LVRANGNACPAHIQRDRTDPLVPLDFDVLRFQRRDRAMAHVIG
jgi:hypothetical protein